MIYFIHNQFTTQSVWQVDKLDRVPEYKKNLTRNTKVKLNAKKTKKLNEVEMKSFVSLLSGVLNKKEISVYL